MFNKKLLENKVTILINSLIELGNLEDQRVEIMLKVKEIINDSEKSEEAYEKLKELIIELEEVKQLREVQ